MLKFGDDKGQLKCSFCGKMQEQVKKLVAGPGVYICDECIELCNEIIEEEFSDDVEKNYITKQEVAEGEKIAAGTTVTIYSSMGIEQVQVPDLSGKTESEAKSAISSAKLKWKSTDKTSDSSKPNGVVVNTDSISYEKERNRRRIYCR